MFSKILIAFDGNNLNVIRALGRVSRSSDVKIFLISVAKINLVEKTIRLFFSLISKEWRPSNYAAIEKSAATAVQDQTPRVFKWRVLRCRYACHSPTSVAALVEYRSVHAADRVKDQANGKYISKYLWFYFEDLIFSYE